MADVRFCWDHPCLDGMAVFRISEVQKEFKCFKNVSPWLYVLISDDMSHINLI